VLATSPGRYYHIFKLVFLHLCSNLYWFNYILQLPNTYSIYYILQLPNTYSIYLLYLKITYFLDLILVKSSLYLEFYQYIFFTFDLPI